MRKKILAFATYPAPYRVEIFENLAKNFDIFAVFNTSTGDNRDNQYFKHSLCLTEIYLDNPDGRKAFEQELKSLNKYDLCLAYDYYLKNSILLQLNCIRRGVPYIINCDGAFIKRNPIKNLLKSFLIRRSSGCFAGCSFAEDYFRHFGAREKNIYRHPFTNLYYSDILERPISKENKQKEKMELGLSQKKMVLSVGQFIYRKGFDLLLKAWTHEMDDKYQLVILGGGELESQYNQYIRDKALEGTIGRLQNQR